MSRSPADRDPWIIRTYTGFGNAEQTNQRFRDNLARGQRGLSVAFDLPTQCGYDADHALARGEVGRAGVSVAHLGDMRALFDGIDLGAINTSMTINATAPWLFALYVALADERGVPREKLRGTTQNDLLKEFVARGTYVFSPDVSLRLTADLIAEAVQISPRFNPINCCGYHLMESAARPEEEVGYALAGAVLVLDTVREKLEESAFLRVVEAISFFVNSGLELVPEIAKMRAYAQLWPALCASRYGVTPRFRAGCQVRSLTLAAEQPEVNIVRIALQALPVLLSATARVGALQLPGFREALGLPDEGEQVLALRTQQVLMHETGLADWPDIFAGSEVVEAETARIKAAAEAIVSEAVAAGYTSTIERLAGLLSERISAHQAAIESGEQVLVGVNRFQDAVAVARPANYEGAAPVGDEEERCAALQRWREQRDRARWSRARAELIAAVVAGESVIAPSIAFATAGGTTGEWTEALLEVTGPRYVAPLGAASVRACAGATVAENPRIRVLLGKAGLDGHVNALRLLAVALRDAGMEVIYAGPGQTATALAVTAVQEAVDVVGVSSLAGNHLLVARELMHALRERGGGGVPVLIGGIIPPPDRETLRAMGVADVFGPGAGLAEIVACIRRVRAPS